MAGCALWRIIFFYRTQRSKVNHNKAAMAIVGEQQALYLFFSRTKETRSGFFILYYHIIIARA